jgi:hypothetical protein
MSRLARRDDHAFRARRAARSQTCARGPPPTVSVSPSAATRAITRAMWRGGEGSFEQLLRQLEVNNRAAIDNDSEVT